MGLESLLGFRKRGDTLRIQPCVPAGRREHRIEYRFGASTYTITVQDPAVVAARGAAVTVDDVAQPTGIIPLIDDGRPHEVTVAPAAATVAPSRQGQG